MPSCASNQKEGACPSHHFASPGLIMPTLKEIASEVAARFKERSRAQTRATLFVKVALITIPAAFVVIAQSLDLTRATHEVSIWTIISIVAASLVLLGGLFVLWTENDPTKTLDTAREALEAAREFEQEKADFEGNITWLSKEVTRGLELYNSMDVMRGAIEQSLDLGGASAAGIMQTCLVAARKSLHVAFDFQIGDMWTICIYEANRDTNAGRVLLHCVAHDRTIQCSLTEARVWQEGIGVVGVAYSRANEIILPDMFAPELGTAFDLGEKARPYDRERYRSMAAIPIIVGAGAAPWGVAIATSSRPGHFHNEPVGGVATAEPIRAIAAMAALAVKALAKSPTLPGALSTGSGTEPAADTGERTKP